MKPEDKERLKKYKPNYNLTYDDIYGKPKVAKTKVTFMDADGKIVDKAEDATKVAIVEEDELGRMIEETFGYLGGSNEDSNKKSR